MSNRPQFDEFGNRIGGGDDEPVIREVIDSDQEENDDGQQQGHAAQVHFAAEPEGDDDDSNMGLGDDVEIIVDDEPLEDISKPLVEPATMSLAAQKGETLLIENRQSSHPTAFLDLLASTSTRNRSFAVVGDLHHGKSSLLRSIGGDFAERADEAERKISLKSNLLSLLVKGKHKPTTFLFNAVDTPGHVDFGDEVAAATRLVDAVLLCVDVVEGVLSNTERIIRQACHEGLKIVLVITKMDRLVLDLKIPPQDAYYKLKLIIDQVNNCIMGTGNKELLVTPHKGTVAFASSKLGFFFTTLSFARKYTEKMSRNAKGGMDPEALALRLWGDVSYDASTKKFVKGVPFGRKETFVSFILEPIYKIIANAITGKGAEIFKREDISTSPTGPVAAASEAIEALLGPMSSEAVDAIVAAIPESSFRNTYLTQRYAIDGQEDFAVVVSMLRAFSMTEVVAVARVVKGTLKQDALVDVVNGSSDVPCRPSTAQTIMLKNTDGWSELPQARAGQLVYIKGADLTATVHRGAVFLPRLEGRLDSARTLPIIPQLVFDPPMVRVGMEPVTESQLPILQKGLDVINKTYPGCDIHVEDNGERILTAAGELYFDTVMHDLRAVLCKDEVNIKLSDPFVPFCESVVDKRGVLAFDDGSAGSKISMTAGKIDSELGLRLESKEFSIVSRPQQLQSVLRQDYHWDVLDAAHVVAIGPDRTRGPNILVDDTLSTKPLARMEKDQITHGFNRVTAEGPLCGEPVRDVKMSLIDLSGNWQRAGLLAAARETTHKALLGAHPCLLEPIFRLEIMADTSCASTIEELLLVRRGQVMTNKRVPGTPFHITRAMIPAIDWFGLEAKMRVETLGKAYPTAYFDHWAQVPGDPFDTSVQIPLLTAARGPQLAADFVLKTRCRKGKKDIRFELLSK